MNNTTIFVLAMLIMAVTMKKTIGFSVLAFFSFILQGKSFDKEGILLSVIAVVLIILQVTMLYIAVTHAPFHLEYK